jgi:DNA-binding beta-propeller fold protein YncE
VRRREFLTAAVAAVPLLAGARPVSSGAPRVAVRAGRAPLALATADTEGFVAVVDLAAGRRIGRVATLDGPRSIEARGRGPVVVAHTSAGAVTLLERHRDRMARRRVLRGFGQPRYTAVAPDGRLAYVTDSGTGELAVLDLVRGRVVRRVAVGAQARHVTLDPAGTTLWVALGSSARRIVVVDVSGDPERPRVVRHVAPPFLAHDVGFAPNGRRAWVTAGESGEVAVYDVRTARVLRTLPSDPGPQHVTFLGGRAFVSSGDAGTLRVYDAETLRLLRTSELPAGSYNVQFAGNRVLTPSLNAGTLCVVDRSGLVKRRLQVAASSHDACLARS